MRPCDQRALVELDDLVQDTSAEWCDWGDALVLGDAVLLRVLPVVQVRVNLETVDKAFLGHVTTYATAIEAVTGVQVP